MISANYEIDDEGLRLLANLEQHYASWVDASRVLLPGRLAWKAVAAREYLYRIVNGRAEAVSPEGTGTKCAAMYHLTLGAGESRVLTFTLGPDELRYWNAAVRHWVIDPTTIDVFAGTDSTAGLTARFTIAS